MPTDGSVLQNAPVIVPSSSGCRNRSRAAGEQRSIAGLAFSVQASAASPSPRPALR